MTEIRNHHPKPNPMLPKLKSLISIITLIFILLCFLPNLKSNAQSLPGYVPTNGLKAYYQFNGNASDLSGNNNNGLVNGAITTTDRFGLSNCAYYFDGASSINVPSSPSNSTDLSSNFSFACWYKLTSYYNGINSKFSPIIQKSNGLGALGHQYKIFVQPQTQTGFWGNEFFGYNYMAVNLDTWYFIAVTFDRGTIKYYVNGVLKRTQVFSIQSLTPTSNGDLEIGKDSPGDTEYLNGSLDDLGIWNRALTQTEITSLYSACVNKDIIFTKDSLESCSKTFTIDAGLGYTSYLWNTGSVNQSINATQSGWYTVNATRNNCTAKDSVYLSIVNGKIENQETEICIGESLTLMVDSNAVSGCNYLWSTNQTTSAINVNPILGQSYYLTASNGITTCKDSVFVEVNLPTQRSFNATACESYMWNGNIYTESGTYLHYYNNENGCLSTDSLFLIINRNPETPQALITQPNTSLFTGSISIITSNEIGILYSINGGQSFQAENSYSNLTPGIYTLVAKNNFGCTSNTTTININPAVNAGIFSGDNNCSYFKTGTASPLGNLCYTGVRGKIFNVTPGVFFYYTLVTAKTSSFIIDIEQTKNLSNFAHFAIHQENQVRMWDANCNRIGSGLSISVGQGRLTINNAIPGNTYVLSVKYNAKSIIGSPYLGSAPDCMYSFISRVNGETVFGSAASINLTSNCNNQSRLNLDSKGPVTTATGPTAYSVYPNPTLSQFRINESNHLSKPVEIRVIDLQGRIMLQKHNCIINNTSFGESLPKGIYFIEITSGNVKKIIKAEKY